MDIEIVFENGKYVVKLNGELSYDTRSISKVEEMFGVDMAAYFADAIIEACLNNGMLMNARKEAGYKDQNEEVDYFNKYFSK